MRVLTLALIPVLAATALFARTIWVDRNPYATPGVLQEGDIVVVQIDDISNLRFTVELGRTSDADVSSEPDQTITGFLPRANARRSFSQQENTQLRGRGNLEISIATRVLNRAGERNYAIGGSKTYTLDGNTHIISVSGIISPSSMDGMEIDSNRVADFTLEVQSIRQGFNLQREAPGEDENASAELTEAEKQRIIVDYLNRILSELTQ